MRATRPPLLSSHICLLPFQDDDDAYGTEEDYGDDRHSLPPRDDDEDYRPSELRREIAELQDENDKLQSEINRLTDSESQLNERVRAAEQRSRTDAEEKRDAMEAAQRYKTQLAAMERELLKCVSRMP